ncbi:MAG: Arm DNA-binding domain-containing protein [Acidiferrobacteraceae bacterium]
MAGAENRRGARMALTDTKPQRLQAREQRYQLADGGGLYLEVQPTGKRVWHMQYRLGGRGSKETARRARACPSGLELPATLPCRLRGGSRYTAGSIFSVI